MNEDTWPMRQIDRVYNSDNSSTEVTSVEDIIYKWLWRTVAPCLLLAGLIGNCYVVRIMLRVRFRKCIKLHLLVLAFTDIIILISGLGRVWIVYTFGVDIRTLSTPGCKVHMFVQFTSICYSAWVLVSYGLERYIAMEFTIYVKSWCPIGRTRLRILLAFVFLSLINCWIFWSVDVIDDGKRKLCTPISIEAANFRSGIFVWIYITFMSLLPFIILTTLNALLIQKLARNCQLQQQLWTRLLRQQKGVPFKKAVVRENRVRFKLLFTTTFFLLTTLPSAVHTVVSTRLWTESEDGHHAGLYLSWTVTSLLQYTNYAFNFVLYTLGTVKREDLLRKAKLSRARSEVRLSRSTSFSSSHDSRRDL